MALLNRLGPSGVGQRSLATRTLKGFWRVPTTATNGTTLHMMVLTGTAPNYTILAQAAATVTGGYAEILAGGGAPGDKRLAILQNYDGNTATASIFGGPSIATYV